MLNIETEFSEHLDFNSVVDTFAKMKNRRRPRQLECSRPTRRRLYHVCTTIGGVRFQSMGAK